MPAPDEILLFTERLESLGLVYMVTGATAAILYGQPRVTNGLDIVLALDAAAIPALERAFPADAFHMPHTDTLRVEQARRQRGHFTIIHHESGFKADVYLAGDDPFHAWALPLRRRLRIGADLSLPVAPPEYVIVRKLEYLREGGSTKHADDVRAILAATPVDHPALDAWLDHVGVAALLRSIAGGPGT